VTFDRKDSQLMVAFSFQPKIEAEPICQYGGMADTGDLKSPAVRRIGSNPITGTIMDIYDELGKVTREMWEYLLKRKNMFRIKCAVDEEVDLPDEEVAAEVEKDDDDEDDFEDDDDDCDDEDLD
jgi:hypothetical protein